MSDERFERIAIYSRKSRFTGKGESIENQIELCRQYIRTQFGDNCAESIVVYEDEGFSGGNLERPNFKIMMSDARKKQFSVIVVYRLDRISRNIGDFAKLIEELSELNIAFISIKEQFDTSSPLGRAMMYIASVFSQLERETIAERIRDNMHELAKTGRWLGGTTPTGYKSVSVEKITVDNKVKKACKLEVIPDEARLIKLIFNKFLETGSLTKTDTYLLQHGYLSKKGNKFNRFTIRGILTNPVYMIADIDAFNYLIENEVDLYSEVKDFDGIHGVIAYNRTIQKTGKANQMQPMEEWIVSVGAHEGLITGKKWIITQRLLEQNSAKSYRKPKSNTALLSGLLFCGNCGDYMRPKLTKRLNKNGDQIYVYMCSTKERSHLQCCNCKNINGNLIDKEVFEEIKNLSSDKLEFYKLLAKSKNQIYESNEDDENPFRLKLKIDKNIKEIESLLEVLKRSTMNSTEEYIIGKIDQLHKENAQLKLKINDLEKKDENGVLSDSELEEERLKLVSINSILEKMSIEQKRSALKSLIDKIVWTDEEVHIYLYGSGLK